MRMVVPPAEPGATSDLGSSEAGSARKLLLDEMLAERERDPLPPAPVLTIQPVPVDAAPVGAGRRGALKRLAEVEALARNNLRAAEEAQRVMQVERQLLEEEASARTKAERTASALRRELERLRSTEEQRAAQARFAANHQARTELATEMERVHDEHSRVVDELDRMRGTLLDHDSLLDEYSLRLHDEQEAQARARAELLRAEEGQRTAERNLEIATETARRRAEDDHQRLVKVEQELRDTTAERDRVTTELRALTTGDGEIARLRTQAEAAHEDMTRLLADLDVQAARADKAESELASKSEAFAQAERVAVNAVEERDLAGIALETTRSELAERNEVIDAERSAAQTHVADLSAQLTTTTRAAEVATERVAELEAQLAAAATSRDDALTRAEDATEQLEHAVADSEQLRTHAASIGDELGATHVQLEESRAQLEAVRLQLHDTRAQLEEARRPVGLHVVDPIDAYDAPPRVDASSFESDPVDIRPSDAPPAAAFDAAIATAFGTADAAAVNDATLEALPDGDAPLALPRKPVSIFRTVDSTLDRPAGGGPEIERETALLRQIAPADPEPAGADDDSPTGTGGEPPAETETWRRTAMAEFSALAADSDDLTPRRRR